MSLLRYTFAYIVDTIYICYSLMYVYTYIFLTSNLLVRLNKCITNKYDIKSLLDNLIIT